MSGFNIELMNGVNNLRSVTERPAGGIAEPKGQAQAGASGGVTFADLLKSQLTESNDLIADASKAAEELVSGKSRDLHGAMISLEKADISFRMLMQVRNKMIDAYREIMRMQV